MEGHVLEGGRAGTFDLGFFSVDEPQCPVQAFHPQGERRLSALVDFTRSVVEHRPVCLNNQGTYQDRLLTADH